MQGDEFIRRMQQNPHDAVVWDCLNPIIYNATRRACYIKRIHTDKVDDLTQDVCIKVFRKWHTYKNKGSLRAWINTIANNTCASHLRNKESRIERQTNSIDQENTNATVETASIKKLFLTLANEQVNIDTYIAKQQAWEALKEIPSDRDDGKTIYEILVWITENNKPSANEMVVYLNAKSESQARNTKSKIFKAVQTLFQRFCDCDLSRLSNREKL
jgi:RNA polymerase sigma factor (sigma-70 family)